MRKFIFSVLVLLFTGGLAMASDNLSSRQQNLVMISSYTANGDLVNLKNSVKKGLEEGLTVNEIKEAYF